MAQLEEVREDAIAEDVEIDLARMSLWTLEQAQIYFENGGVEEHEIAAWLRTVGLVEYASSFRMHFDDLDAIRERILATIPSGMSMDPALAKRAQLASANKVLDICGVKDEPHRKKLRVCLSAIVMFDLGSEGTGNAASTLDVSSVRLYNTHSSRAFSEWLGAKLLPLQPKETPSKAISFASKPGASVRLFGLYGIGDDAGGFQAFAEKAPAWLEV